MKLTQINKPTALRRVSQLKRKETHIMADLTQLSTEELHEGYREYSAEINRRHELQRIPQEISDLAQQGHDIGIEKSAMIDAVTNSTGYPLEIDESQA